MVLINTEQRTNDWIAFLDGNRGKWESGRTEVEAIGNLVISHANSMGVMLSRQPRKSIYLEGIC